MVIRNTMKTPNLGKKVRVGDLLVSEGLVTQNQIEAALSNQDKRKKKRIGNLLIEKGLITEDQLLLALSAKFQMRLVDLKDITPSQTALNALSSDLVGQLKVIPLEADGKHIVVATSDPTDHTIADTLQFNTNCNIELVSATSNQISAAIEKYYSHAEDSMDLLIDGMVEDEIEVEEEVDDSSIKETDSQVIKFVNGILLDAYHKGASDIHLEPKSGKGPIRVRYRIEGECHIEHQIPATFKRAILSRVKIMSNLDIAERRKPQSGKILLRVDKKKIEYRVEITPTVGDQEDAVLRILSSSRPLSLKEMKFSEPNLERFKNIIAKPYGMILCVGPTGSGKTTSLHSALSHINKPNRKIWTAEDPVEITQDGLRQVQVNPKIKYSFQEALRSFLRADPDVIMIGEMRDAETAKTAIEASLTGHLVFSTLHTNSAPESVVRLVEMGMNPFNFADAMLGILAQRLVRMLCNYCKKPLLADKDAHEKLVQIYGREYFVNDGLEKYSDEFYLMNRVGCPKCAQSGYRGRLALHELLDGTEAIKVAIKQNTPLERLRDIAIEDGMRTLKMDGIQKILNGLIDLDQVNKVVL